MQRWLKTKNLRIQWLPNWKIKLPPKEDRATLLVCIGIALFFWLLVKLSRTYASTKGVSFQFELPSGKTFIRKPPSNTQVQLSGSGWELLFDYLYSPTVALQYDLSKYTQATLTNTQLRNDIKRKIVFNNIRVLDIADNISLQLEDGVTKRVPILLADSLTFASGYHLTKPMHPQPDSVAITGPFSQINTITDWKTIPFKLENLKGNVLRNIPLETPAPELTLNVKEIQLSIIVEQLTEKSLFIPLVVRNAPADSLKYFPEMVKVTCTIGLSDYNSVDTKDFSMEIDLAKVSLKQGKHTIPIQIVRQPTQALRVQFTPKSAEFFIFKR